MMTDFASSRQLTPLLPPALLPLVHSMLCPCKTAMQARVPQQQQMRRRAPYRTVHSLRPLLVGPSLARLPAAPLLTWGARSLEAVELALLRLCPLRQPPRLAPKVCQHAGGQLALAASTRAVLHL